MDVSHVIRQGSISQGEKDRCNSLDLCCYCNEPRYIAIDHKNLALLTTKRQAAVTLTGNSIALVLYKPFSVEKKEMFLG